MQDGQVVVQIQERLEGFVRREDRLRVCEVAHLAVAVALVPPSFVKVDVLLG